MIKQETITLPFFHSERGSLGRYYNIMDFDKYFNNTYDGFELINVQVLDYDKESSTMEYIFWIK